MAIFNSYVSLPEGKPLPAFPTDAKVLDLTLRRSPDWARGHALKAALCNFWQPRNRRFVDRVQADTGGFYHFFGGILKG